MPRELLEHYPQASDRYDEMLAAPLAPREHWRTMLDSLGGAAAESMRERLQSVQDQVRENGVTYNVYADPQGADRPWELDLLPMVLPQDEWAGIEAGVAQRAALLNKILVDVYGEQRLLKEGLLPPGLIYGHAGFLRPCVGAKVPGDTMLHLYAADLARSPDGRWWVIDDRTQAPSGAGYALENRIIISRAFPQLFRDLKVQHLASFFATLRDSLAAWAPPDREKAGAAPFTVLLTPGPHNETYFEHTYLARYLGIALVEGSDLTVRDGYVCLKTLSGLKRVHAILRRLDDDYCDPLELRSDSALGVPGLVDAVRRGNVLVANALGSNLLESSTLFGYLPGLAEKVLGEPLKMPSVATWWCGEPAALKEVEANIGRLVIKAAFPQLRVEPMFGEDLDERGRKRVLSMLRARPNDYVAQELVHLSQAPVWDRAHPRRILARAIGLRVYACASPNGYVVMPGGLTRVASAADARVISMQRGGSSKDTWVMAAGPVSTFSLLRRAVGPDELVRSGTNLSSRVVENLYWYGRYSERCDGAARLLRIALLHYAEDVPGADDERSWPVIVGLLRHAGVAMEGVPQDAELAVALRAAITDESLAGLAGNARQLARVAANLRERLSLDQWRTVNRLTQALTQRKTKKAALLDLLGELDAAIGSLTTLAGFALDGMTRDPGWRFLSVGRRIERLQWMCALLKDALAGPPDMDLTWLLRAADSIITYRARYRARPEWMPTFDLLIRDEANPRSIAFQVRGLYDYAQRLTDLFGEFGDEAFGDALASLAGIDPGVDLQPGAPRLARCLDGWRDASFRLAEQVSLRFFSHVGEASRQTFAT